jgi:hypothetical protein
MIKGVTLLRLPTAPIERAGEMAEKKGKGKEKREKSTGEKNARSAIIITAAAGGRRGREGEGGRIAGGPLPPVAALGRLGARASLPHV